MTDDATKIESLSDDALLRRLSSIVCSARRIEAVLVATIAEVDRRRLYAVQACSSMFSYCTEVLNLSESEAYLRIAVARASCAHPALLEMLADGRLHLRGIAKIAPYLTAQNRDSVLGRAAGMSTRRVEELIAELAPKPDVPSTIRKLPTPRQSPTPQLEPRPVARLSPDGAASRPVAPPATPRPEPLAPSRYKVQFTASTELKAKLERLGALMRDSDSETDLADIIDAAVTEKLDRLEAKRLAKTRAPRTTLEQTDTTPTSRYVPAAVRRAVSERDSGRCTFVNAQGRRCSERSHVEFHHEKPFARGGSHEPDNIRLLCHAHNTFQAERDYGTATMERYRRPASRVRESSPVYFVGAAPRVERSDVTRTGLVTAVRVRG